MEYRVILAVLLSMLVLFLYQILFPPPPPQHTLQPQNQDNITIPQQSIKQKDQITTTTNIEHQELISLDKSTQDKNPKDIKIETPNYIAIISEKGLEIKSFVLKKYKEELKEDSKYIDVIKLFTVQKNTLNLHIQEPEESKINLSKLIFDADREEIIISDEEKGLINFVATLPNGKKIIAQFTFHRDKYLITINFKTDIPVNGYSYVFEAKKTGQSSYIFEGPSYFANGLYEEVSIKNGKSVSVEENVDWVSFGDKYFMFSIIPMSKETKEKIEFEMRSGSEINIQRLISISEKKSSEFSLGLFIGPKEYGQLKSCGYNLHEAINFGWFHVFAMPLFFALRFINQFLNNYGLSIIALTVIIKLLFWPLTHQSSKSMKVLQKIQPKLKKIQEKYKDDREKLNKEILQLYKTYKINPFSGCLPVLIQIPIFFALYKVLLQAIELRHAPFFLWINDLSAPDRLMIGIEIPFLGGIPVLTILMGLSMWIQQKMTPTTLDPVQAKIMEFVPLVFTFLFVTFPSGLVLYWLVNNILSIIQQYYINKYTD